MNNLPLALCLGVAFSAVRAADAPVAEPAANSISVLRGQWNFLNASVAFCAEKVPAMQAQLVAAHDHAEQEMRRADETIQQAVADRQAIFKPLIASYTSGWIKYAETLLQSFKQQDPVKACPSLLSSWQDTDADQILEDWRGFVARSGVADN